MKRKPCASCQELCTGLLCSVCYLYAIKKVNYCIECGKELSRYDAKRCRSCSKKGKLNNRFGIKYDEELLNKLRGQRISILGNKNPNWKNGIKIVQGYVYLYQPNHPFAKKNYVKRANLKYESKINKIKFSKWLEYGCVKKYPKKSIFLQKGQIIHHRDRNRENDIMSNLKFFKSRSDHQKYHWRINP